VISYVFLFQQHPVSSDDRQPAGSAATEKTIKSKEHPLLHKTLCHTEREKIKAEF